MLAGYYILVLFTGVALFMLPWLVLWIVGVFWFPLLAGMFVGPALVFSLVPRGRKESGDPGVRFTADTQPELTGLVREVALAAHQPMPSHCFLTHALNAFVANRPGDRPRGQTLAIGLPLLVVLSPDQLRAVIAHEFGHFNANDTTLASLVYRTRWVMRNTLNVTHSHLTAYIAQPILKYCRFYLRATASIGRTQELAADQFAANLTSPNVLATSLAVLPAAEEAFENFAREYNVIWQAGFFAPVIERFNSFVAAQDVRSDLRTEGNARVGVLQASPYDSHPELPVRLHALGCTPEQLNRNGDLASAAITLVRNLPAVDEEIFRINHQRMRIEWAEVPKRVYAPMWRSRVEKFLLPEFGAMRISDIPLSKQSLATLGATAACNLQRPLAKDQYFDFARSLMHSFIGLAAVKAGMSAENPPGSPLLFRGDRQAIDFIDLYDAAMSTDPERWQAAIAECRLTASVAEVCADTPVGTSTALISPED